MTARKKKEAEKIAPKFAMEICDSMDLPDGAYWAMVEEMSGCDAADCVDCED